MWMDVPYEPGELKVVAYDASGKPAEEKIVRTAGKPHHLELVADRTRLAADGKDLPTHCLSALSIKTAISARRTIVLFLSL